MEGAQRYFNKVGMALARLHEQVGPGEICFLFCPNSLCLTPQIQPVMLEVCPIMPNYAQ